MNFRRRLLVVTALAACLARTAAAQQAILAPSQFPPGTDALESSPDVQSPTGRLYFQPGEYGYGATIGERNFHDLDVHGTLRFHSAKDDVNGGLLAYFHPFNLHTHVIDTGVGKFTLAGSAGAVASLQYINREVRRDVRAQIKSVETMSNIPYLKHGIKLGTYALFALEFRAAEKASEGLRGPYFNVKSSVVVLSTPYGKGLVNYNERRGAGFDINSDPPHGWSAGFDIDPETLERLKRMAGDFLHHNGDSRP